MINKILIVSDSHGRSQNIKTVIDKEQPDMLIHLGDIEDDPDKVREWLDAAAKKKEAAATVIPAVFIQGNCDRSVVTGSSGTKLKSVAVFEVNGHRFYCCHGHHERVDYGYENLIYSARENDCDIALYGHTHRSFDDVFDVFGLPGENVRVLNPGSISLPRGGEKKSYMVMLFNGDEYSVELKKL